MGVIDSLGRGFHIALKRWWVLLIPVVLDTFLWLGPRLSVAQMVQERMRSLDRQVLALAEGDAKEEWRTFSTFVGEAAEHYNMFYALRSSAFGVPSLFAWSRTRVGSHSVYETLWIYFVQVIGRPDLLPAELDANSITWQVNSLLVMGGAGVVLSLCGLAIGCLYLTGLAGELHPAEGPGMGTRALRLGGRFLLFWFLRAVLAVIAGVPIITLVGLVNLVSPALAMLVIVIVLMVTMWLSFLGIFMVASLAVNDAPLWEAIWNSVNVVLRNVGPTAWLFVLINLIGGGMAILWHMLSANAGLTWVAILGNAYVGSGLVAASLVFYRERYARWQEALSRVAPAT